MYQEAICCKQNAVKHLQVYECIPHRHLEISLPMLLVLQRPAVISSPIITQ